MPLLDWIGKDAVVRHHHDVPYRLLCCDKKKSAGEIDDTDNLLVQGDNLEALKALLPYYQGKVKVVYIDPPYNTGNEGWVFNDKLNSKEFNEWLNKTVGPDGQDMCRHDKWLCMMYPRLRLLRDFLRKDGVIFVSIDDNEHHHLRMLMDEIFGAKNFVNSFAWVNKIEGRQIIKSGAAKTYESILAYAKNINSMGSWISMDLQQAAKLMPTAYKIPKAEVQRDEVGDFIATHELHNHNHGFNEKTRQNLVFVIHYNPDENKVRFSDVYENVSGNPEYDGFVAIRPRPILGEKNRFYAWRWSRDTIQQELHNLLFEKCGKSYRIYTKRRNFVHTKIKDLITNIGSGRQSLCQVGLKFPNPKPVKLIELLLRATTKHDDIILDSFAGSGTTGHAVLSLNKSDGGTRRFILMEMDKDISENITATRLQRVVEGYNEIEPLGGGFRFYRLDSPLFDAIGNIADGVKFPDLAAHVFFYATGMPIPKRANEPLLGVDVSGRAIYLLFNNILEGGNVLTSAILSKLPIPPHGNGSRAIFGEACRLPSEVMKHGNIEFFQIPHTIKSTYD